MKQAFRFSVHSGRFGGRIGFIILSFFARNLSSKINTITVCFVARAPRNDESARADIPCESSVI
jgi:hypothetical protein